MFSSWEPGVEDIKGFVLMGPEASLKVIDLGHRWWELNRE